FDPSYGDYEFRKQDKRAVLVDATALALLAKDEDKEEPEETVMEPDDASKAAPDEEGKFGDPELPDTIETRLPKNDARMVNKVPAKNVGLVDILKSQKLQNMTAMSNILAANTASMNSKLAVAMAGSGTEFTLGGGTDGMGFRGTGPGGGGEGPFGRIHGLGKIDRGGDGLETGVALGPKKPKRIGRLDTSGGQSAGFCKKENIASVVRSRASAIRACYEARLQVNEKLAGKLTARWTIGVDGKVTAPSISSNTVGDPAVGSCLLGVVRRLNFQKPEGGVCIVQWPFVFNPG
ncbi:MAG: AgmX/PglI C-terminal domain-containing protein, partial [Myxococcales bacterium]|nr:AgmX/PglI C-terminal domain-containing protein [Myxococcales bacterium]